MARDLVNALKHRRSLAVAGRMATLISQRHPGWPLDAPAIPVPSQDAGTRWRGFTPADEIARELAQIGSRGSLSLLRRGDRARQVGRSRGERRAGAIEATAIGPVPPDCVLIDDVMTTGGTLSACAVALRGAGAVRVRAVTFTRRR